VCFSFPAFVFEAFTGFEDGGGGEGLRRAPNKNPIIFTSYRKGIRLIFLNQDEDKKRDFASMLRAFFFLSVFLGCGMVEGGQPSLIVSCLWSAGGAGEGLFLRKGGKWHQPNVFWCGNANEPREVSRGPRKSSLFFLTVMVKNFE